MGNQVTQQPQKQQQYQQLPEPKAQQIQIENALNTLQSMFDTVDRSVLRMILVEQCKGNIDLAVNTLLTMTGGGGDSNNSMGTRTASQNKSSSNVTKKAEVILYDDNMRPMTISDDFLQPPSYFLSKYLNITPMSLSFNKLPPVRRKIDIDPVIIAKWTQLMNKYKFKNEQEMDRKCKGECLNVNKCGSLIRVIFMMRLYNNLCNGAYGNIDDGYLMNQYLHRGFKNYSLIQLINDCNHLMQYHQLTNSSRLNLKTIKEKNKFENKMRSYFGHCDVMNCKIIKRILQRQDNDDNKNKMSDIDVDTDVVDKYHRVFYHPMN